MQLRKIFYLQYAGTEHFLGTRCTRIAPDVRDWLIQNNLKRSFSLIADQELRVRSALNVLQAEIGKCFKQTEETEIPIPEELRRPLNIGDAETSSFSMPYQQYVVLSEAAHTLVGVCAGLDDRIADATVALHESNSQIWHELGELKGKREDKRNHTKRVLSQIGLRNASQWQKLVHLRHFGTHEGTLHVYPSIHGDRKGAIISAEPDVSKAVNISETRIIFWDLSGDVKALMEGLLFVWADSTEMQIKSRVLR